MKVAAIYDVHGNLPALEAVLDEIQDAGVGRVVVGGDVLPGPMGREAMGRLRNLEGRVEFLRGNGERAVLERRRGEETGNLPAEARLAIGWMAEQLSSDDEQWIASWPDTLAMQIDELGEVLFCHATPRNDTEIFTHLTSEEKLLPVFAPVTAGMVVCGHTHMQFQRWVGNIQVVNAGSVGMPFGEPGAYWLLLGPAGAELRRTTYDLGKAAERIRATNYPQAAEFAAQYVLRPPTEEAMREVFGRTELS